MGCPDRRWAAHKGNKSNERYTGSEPTISIPGGYFRDAARTTESYMTCSENPGSEIWTSGTSGDVVVLFAERSLMSIGLFRFFFGIVGHFGRDEPEPELNTFLLLVVRSIDRPQMMPVETFSKRNTVPPSLLAYPKMSKSELDGLCS